MPVATMCTRRLCEHHGSSHSIMARLLYPEVGNAGQCKESNVTKHFITEICYIKMESACTFWWSQHTGVLEVREVYKFCRQKLCSIEWAVLIFQYFSNFQQELVAKKLAMPGVYFGSCIFHLSQNNSNWPLLPAHSGCHNCSVRCIMGKFSLQCCDQQLCHNYFHLSITLKSMAALGTWYLLHGTFTWHSPWLLLTAPVSSIFLLGILSVCSFQFLSRVLLILFRAE